VRSFPTLVRSFHEKKVNLGEVFPKVFPVFPEPASPQEFGRREQASSRGLGQHYPRTLAVVRAVSSAVWQK